MHVVEPNNGRKLNVWLPLLFALVLVIGMLIGMRLHPEIPPVIVEANHDLNPSSLGQGKIEELIRYIEAKYVDDVDRQKLIQEAIDEILAQLDPHSNYITAEQLQEVNEQLEGNFDGIGIEFMVLEDTIVVVAPLTGGPSEAAGIMAGDKIVQVGDSVIVGNGIETRKIMDMLRGEKGTKVRVGIRRGNESSTRFFDITRDEIPVQSVDIAYMLQQDIGYVKINRFSATTYEEFLKGIEEMVENKQMKHLIIDLRHNPGGYLQQATNILNQLFREKDKLMVYTEGRSVHRNDYESTGRAYYNIDQVAVLIDEGSASASEIMAGAIQDHDRGVIIGRRSFGKGLVQEQYKLRDGSALRLTVARYYTPSGRLIQKPYKDNSAYDDDLSGRFERGELSKEDAQIEISDSTKYYTSSGRVVFGGGGISPDENMFVPIDTTLLNDAYLNLRQFVPQFAFRYLSDNPFPVEMTLEEFSKTWKVDSNAFQEFLRYAKDNGLDITSAIAPKIRTELMHLIKARIAKQLYGNEGFYSIWNQKDAAIQKALNAITNPQAIK